MASNLLRRLLKLAFPPEIDSNNTPLLDEPQDADNMPPQPPPSYTDISPHSSDPDRRTCTPPSEMDPLVLSALQNQSYSPLHRLPDHILIRILDMLDNSGIECLRRCSRRFPPICANVVLGRPRTSLPVADVKTGLSNGRASGRCPMPARRTS